MVRARQPRSFEVDPTEADTACLGGDADACWWRAGAFLQTGDADGAAAAFEEFGQRHGDDPRAELGARLVGPLRGEVPAAGSGDEHAVAMPGPGLPRALLIAAVIGGLALGALFSAKAR